MALVCSFHDRPTTVSVTYLLAVLAGDAGQPIRGAIMMAEVYWFVYLRRSAKDLAPADD